MGDQSRPAGEPDAAASAEIVVSNEFAAVSVRKVYTRNGARLEIRSPRMGQAIRLDALALESLTWQTMETFTRFLETPYGPER
jgi:hypothetical protein